MANIWILSGGAISGTQTLDALGITNAQLKLGSLIEDRLTFSQVFENAAAVQEIGNLQEVELWRDGVRFFKGLVTDQRTRDTSKNGLQIDTTVSGVWWWLQQTPLSGQAQGSDGGDLRERIAFAFPEGDLRAHIISIIDRAKTLGVSIDVGGISSCYNVPQITLKQMTCADAIAELMRFIPDAAAYINYAGEVPTFNIKRRGVATAETLTVGEAPCTSIDVNPKLELETTQVAISYVERAVDGKSVFKEQIHGTATNGKRQILTISGPELDTFLPNDLFDTETVKSSDIFDNGILPFNLVKTLNPQVGDFSAAHADFFLVPSYDIYFGTAHYHYPSPTLLQRNGQPPGSAYKYFMTKGEWRDWFGELGIKKQTLKCSGYWVYWRSGSNPVPSWIDDFQFEAHASGSLVPNGPLNERVLSWVKLDFDVIAVDTKWATDTALYRAADYTFVKPPAGFAQELLETQDFTPYEGVVTVAAAEAGWYDYRGRVLNIAGSLTKHATMKAIVQGVNYNLQAGATTIELGTAQRLNFLGLIHRFRRTASDNIIWLSGAGGIAGGGIGSSITSGGSTSTDDGTGDTGETVLYFGGIGPAPPAPVAEFMVNELVSYGGARMKLQVRVRFNITVAVPNPDLWTSILINGSTISSTSPGGLPMARISDYYYASPLFPPVIPTGTTETFTTAAKNVTIAIAHGGSVVSSVVYVIPATSFEIAAVTSGGINTYVSNRVTLIKGPLDNILYAF